MTFFLVIDLVLRIFPFFSHIFRMFTMLNVVYDHFLTRKPPFFTLFVLSRTSDNTASQNIGGDQCMGRPPPQIWKGTVPPVPPRSPPLIAGTRAVRRCHCVGGGAPVNFCRRGGAGGPQKITAGQKIFFKKFQQKFFY